jgi:iron complex transport system ATP-binding protein
MKTLVDEGYVVTAGVLNYLDSDYETCELLKIPAVTDAPFSPITDKADAENMKMINDASMVVVTSVPFGSGNLRNLEAAKEALKQGIPTYVIDEVPIEYRDFTGGKATELMLDLKRSGATFVKQQSELPALLNISADKMRSPQKAQTAEGHIKEREN